MIISTAGFSVPVFVVGYLLAYTFALDGFELGIGFFPVQGYTPIEKGIWPWFLNLLLPAVALGLIYMALIARITRATMLEVLSQDYVRTARAKGLSGARVVLRHALPNALLPIVAMIGIDIGQFMGGVVVVEAVYGWPGIGQLAWQAIQQADVPIIMGVTLVSSLAIVLGNLLADAIAPLLDPKIRIR
jgi:peptide/nickel transport system permease protein